MSAEEGDAVTADGGGPVNAGEGTDAVSAGGRGLAFGTDAALWEVMSTMRAMRRLSPEPVPRELLERLVQAATWAPSGSNLQAYSWVIVTDREVMARLEPVWGKCFELYWATVGPTAGEAMNEDQVAALRRAVTYQREHFLEIPALLVACYERLAPQRRVLSEWRSALPGLAALGPRDLAAVARSAQRATAMGAAASVYPGVQNLLLSARALGLGATLTTLHLTFEAEFKRVLGIPRQIDTFAVVPVGWPLGRFGPVRRKSAAEAIHWDRW
jgi:nitroreductase